MKNKKFFLSLAAFLISLSSFAGPRYDPNEPDLPLPHGSEVGIGLLVAIVVLPIGYFIFKSNDSSNSSDISASKGCFSLRINDGRVRRHKIIHPIEPKKKTTFKFLSDTIPDVRSVFLIRGKRYICEKLTATFTENGMSQLIKGVFYPIKDN